MKKNNILAKFTVVAAMIGLFSPSVTVETNVQSSNSYSVTPITLNISLLNTAEARRGGGGARRGGGGARRSSGSRNRGNTRNKNRNTNRNKNTNRNSNRNVNRNSNRNVNRNVNVNVNHNNRYYGGHGHHRGGGYGYYRGAPILAFASIVAIGSIVAASTMPSTCTTVVTGGVSYRRCDNAYYQPFYEGDTLVYRSVNSPY